MSTKDSLSGPDEQGRERSRRRSAGLPVWTSRVHLGDSYDNALMENFFSTLKIELRQTQTVGPTHTSRDPFAERA